MVEFHIQSRLGCEMMMNDELVLWLSRGFDYELFPRKVRIELYSPGRGAVTLVRDIYGPKPIVDYIKRRNNDTDVYVNIYSNYQITNSIYDTVIFDIDVHDKNVSGLGDVLNRAYEKLQAIRKFLLDFGFDFSRVYISGRGFHAYVDFTPVTISSFDELYLTMIRRINEQLGGEYIDENYYNVRFFDRIPFSKNRKIRVYDNGFGISVKRINFTKDNWREAILGVVEHRYFNDFPRFMKDLEAK